MYFNGERVQVSESKKGFRTTSDRRKSKRRGRRRSQQIYHKIELKMWKEEVETGVRKRKKKRRGTRRDVQGVRLSRFIRARNRNRNTR